MSPNSRDKLSSLSLSRCIYAAKASALILAYQEHNGVCTLDLYIQILLVTFTFCCAERLSLRENTAPPTEVSRQGPQVALPPQKSPRGCIMSTPLVVSPSISWFSVHFVAFSWNVSCFFKNVLRYCHLILFLSGFV